MFIDYRRLLISQTHLKVNIGVTAVFICDPVDNNPIQWKFNGGKLRSNMQSSLNKFQSWYELTITNVTLNDVGRYGCYSEYDDFVEADYGTLNIIGELFKILQT